MHLIDFYHPAHISKMFGTSMVPIARNTGHCIRTGLNVVGTLYIDIQL